MIEVRNQKEFIKAVKKAERNTVIFYDEDGMDFKYGKSKLALELVKEIEGKIKNETKNYS